MFDELRSAFREALENFNKELSREHVPETVDRLISGMVDEITSTKAHVADLESQLEKATAVAAREKQEAETARRREQMARQIDDTETADLAGQYAAKHEEHQGVLAQKIEALQAELTFSRKEVELMMEKVKEAKTKRSTLAATTGRTGARGTMSGADGPVR